MNAITNIMMDYLMKYIASAHIDAQSAWADSHLSSEKFCASQLPPFEQGTYICFNATAFARSIGIKDTTVAGKLHGYLSLANVEFRQTVTIQINGGRQVIKAARIQADSLFIAEKSSGADSQTTGTLTSQEDE